MPAPEEAFWLVWCPTGTAPPRKRHDSYDAAHREAERLANSAPSARFYVVKAIAVVEHRTTVTTSLGDPEIPF